MTEQPSERPAVPGKDLQEALKDLRPGWYSAAGLLDTYNAWAASNGRPEADTHQLGVGMYREFATAPSRKVKGVTERYLDKVIVAHRDWFRH